MRISAACVQTVLDYLLAAGPLPAHLISRPLLQRHHFLALSPEDGAEYVAWPSVDRSRAVFLLQSEPIPPPEPPLAVNYSADSENLIAHVRITPDLRLLFLWDSNTSAWLYHNLALMPFPPASDPSFEKAYAIYSPEDFLPEPGYSITVDPDDDSYWDSYGGPDDDDDRHPTSKDAQDVNANSEDAYWAQYSAVQGSGDSTLPSPRPGKVKDYLAADIDHSSQGRIIIPSDELQLHRNEPYNPLEPPQPDALATRLAALAMQPRSGAASPPLIDDSPTSDTESNTASPRGMDTASIPASSSETSASHRQSEDYLIVDAAIDTDDPAQDILRDHIKSLYKLWQLGRPTKPAEQDKDLFLAAVQQALTQL